MSKAGWPGKPSKLSSSSLDDDLPEATRETLTSQPQKKLTPLMGIVGLAIVVAIGGTGWWMTRSRNPIASTPASNPVTNNSSGAPAGTVLNHYPYPEAPTAELEAITADGGLKLRKAAAQAYKEMAAAAQTEGISLMPLSAFRSISEQEQVFLSLKQQRIQTAEQRAAVSAPPGYSEHHTGYAIDIGDGNVPATNLSPDFEQTAAFKWLQANAPRYNFEMSFPKNNKQGVSYEPWHWRFVGDRQSLETFFKARGQQPESPGSTSPSVSPDSSSRDSSQPESAQPENTQPETP
ncbi:D-alanyl-D-alanine carboxypeptidase family protein [Alkalinema sp. FACHB-956]|uniref:D-alanyl-D-alanine carboxypeptidase family protein n=1 Tax=Alkalinema sp. FACHB-956 TaxID=2692768 RepID=UPI001685C4BF|nr:D-alanyl-D-alanine carboxypeptidase family protein [Alkalinema sp. FACHB-956]